jgi:hypothetical protein
VIRDADEIAARFFSRCENEAYRALEPRDKPLGFFNCWTRKIAFIKAIGDGLYPPLDCFDVSLAPGEPAKILRVEGKSGDHCGWCLDSFSPAPGFVAAVVTESRNRHFDLIDTYELSPMQGGCCSTPSEEAIPASTSSKWSRRCTTGGVGADAADLLSSALVQSSRWQ